MADFAFHASHEQFTPSSLVRLAIQAREAGFDSVHSSDHFYPWSVRQGQSGFAFSWMGAAMQACDLPFGMICAPGQRYHPAIAAQAIATLAEMFPGKLTCVELGSGEALNENITAEKWPSKEVRNERLKECATIIRRMLNGEEVTYNGHVKVREARLYTLPAQKPALFCAAISAETAAWAADWADGLVTVSGTRDEMNKKISAFRKRGGNEKPVYIKYSFSYHPDRQIAIDGAYDQWRTNIIPSKKLADLSRPEDFDRIAEEITKEDVIRQVPIHTTIDEVMVAADNIAALGVQSVILHNVNTHQELFVKDFGTWKKNQ